MQKINQITFVFCLACFSENINPKTSAQNLTGSYKERLFI